MTISDVFGFVVLVVIPPVAAIAVALGVASQITTPGHWAGDVLGLAAGVFAVIWVRHMLERA